VNDAVWQAILSRIGEYPSLVLTGRDPHGYPVNLRCRPRPDHHARVLQITAPAWFDAQPGAASLMGHSHDEHLWNLRNAIVRGTLEIDGDRLTFHPVAVAGTPQGVRALVQTLIGTRRAAAGYLARRRVARPRVPWQTINAAKRALS
jgi:hypothetical protein